MKISAQKIETTSTSRRGFLKTSATVAGTALIGALDVGRFVHAAESSTIKLGLIGCGGRGTGAAGDALTGDSGTKLWAAADIPQSLIHNLDSALWALGDVMPEAAYGMGGRSTHFQASMGTSFDHHHVTYEYADGRCIYASCRTAVGCFGFNKDVFHGTKGRCCWARARHARTSGSRTHFASTQNCHDFHPDNPTSALGRRFLVNRFQRGVIGRRPERH